MKWHKWMGPASEGEERREQKESERRRSGEGFAGLQRGADAEGIRVTWKEIYSVCTFLVGSALLFCELYKAQQMGAWDVGPLSARGSHSVPSPPGA